MRILAKTDILDYEIQSSRWAKHIKWAWLQDLAGTYFARKVNRKYERYLTRKNFEHFLEEIREFL